MFDGINFNTPNLQPGRSRHAQQIVLAKFFILKREFLDNPIGIGLNAKTGCNSVKTVQRMNLMLLSDIIQTHLISEDKSYFWNR